MVHNCTYNKTKLLHELTAMSGFIDRFGTKDAGGKHKGCQALLQSLNDDLKKHIKSLSKAVGEN